MADVTNTVSAVELAAADLLTKLGSQGDSATTDDGATPSGNPSGTPASTQTPTNAGKNPTPAPMAFQPIHWVTIAIVGGIVLVVGFGAWMIAKTTGRRHG